MVKTTPFAYYMLSESIVAEDVAMKHRKVLSENVTSINGVNLFTVTYEQVLQDFNVRNWNGRIYDEHTVVGAIENNPLIQHDLKMHTWTGEYGHPMIEKGQNELQRQMTIDPYRACNTIDSYRVDGNLLIGKCTTLAGGQGEVLRDRILTNYPAMASSRAIGGVDKNGKVLPGYTLITFDSVIRPSHKTAYQRGGANINDFSSTIGSLRGNTMTESAVMVDLKGEAVKSFLLSESVSRAQIDRMCDAFDIDYSSVKVENHNLTFQHLTENTVDTIIIPINRMVNAEYYNLFD